MNNYLKRKMMNDGYVQSGIIYEQHPNQSYLKAQNQDGRNPYGSKGGYVDSNNSDYKMDHRMDYQQYDSRYNDRNYSNDGYGYHFHGVPQYIQPNAYQMYAQVTPQMYPQMDYNRGGSDYHGSEKQGEKYNHDLKKLCKKLEKYNKFPNVRKEEVLQQAQKMGVNFNKYSEEEYMTTYYLMMAEHPMDLLNSPQSYMILAKDWLKSKVTKFKNSSKLAAYYYEIVKGGNSFEDDEEEDD